MAAPTPKRRATSSTVMLESRSIALAAARSPSLRDRGRPPLRPLARAASRPAVVRSRITERSNSASAAKTWNTSLPVAVDVSMLS